MKKIALFTFLIGMAQILVPVQYNQQNAGDVFNAKLFLYRVFRNASQFPIFKEETKYDQRGRIIGYTFLAWHEQRGRYVALVETTCRPMVAKTRKS